MVIKRNISFVLRPYGKNDSAYQIQMYVTFKGYRLRISTGCILNKADAWDEKAQLVNDNYVGPHGEEALSMNNKLRNCREQMDTAFKYFEATDVFPNTRQLSDKYYERINGVIPQRTNKDSRKKEPAPKQPSFFEIYDMFTRECGEKNAWTEATFEKMAALKEDLVSFRPDINFSDLDETGLTAFVTYLRDEKVLKTPRKKKEEGKKRDNDDLIGLRNTTIEKKLGYLRWFLNWATARGDNANMAYKTFKPTLKTAAKKVIYLTKDELDRLRNYQIPKSKIHLEPVRDVFLFCCFTGLRHSDAFNLRRADIKDDHLEVTTVKTADSISIELNKTSREILVKYEAIQFPRGKALPEITNQEMNRHLKTLCELAGIDEEIRLTTYKGNVRTDVVKKKWELVGTHTGRRTFIVNALSLGIPPNVVMKWTGHSDYKSMKPYIDIVDATKAKAMSKFDELL